MLNKAHEIWKSIRRRVAPQRIYRFGTAGLSCFDDRTLVEKIFDKVDSWFLERKQKQRQERAYSLAWRSREWVDKMGNTSQRIRESEKNGYAYMTDREWTQIANNAKKRIKQEETARIKKKVEFAVSEIKKGRKYSQEWGHVLQKLKDK